MSFLVKVFTVQVDWNWWQTTSLSNSSSSLQSSCLCLFQFQFNTLIHVQLYQLVPVTFRICINLVQCTRSNTFCQSMRHAHNSTSLSNVHSDNILSIPVASLGHFPSLNLNWSSPSTFLIFPLNPPSRYHRYYLGSMCNKADWWLLHSVAFGFFFKAIIVTSVHSWATLQFHILLISCVTILRPSPPNSLSTSPGHHHFLQLSNPSSDSFFHFTSQNTRAFLIQV